MAHLECELNWLTCSHKNVQLFQWKNYVFNYFNLLICIQCEYQLNDYSAFNPWQMLNTIFLWLLCACLHKIPMTLWLKISCIFHSWSTQFQCSPKSDESFVILCETEFSLLEWLLQLSCVSQQWPAVARTWDTPTWDFHFSSCPCLADPHNAYPS